MCTVVRNRFWICWKKKIYSKKKYYSKWVPYFFKKLLRWQCPHFVDQWYALCFGLRLTSPMGFEARVGAPLPVLSVCASSSCTLGDNSNFFSQCLVPIVHLGMRLLLEWPPNVNSKTDGTGRIRIQDLVAQSLMLYCLSSPGRDF